MGRTVSVRLPSAPPTDYLRWVAYVRQVNEALRRLPMVAAVAVRDTPPLDEATLDVAMWLAREINRSALAAQERGDRWVVPQADVEAGALRHAVAYFEQRARWLDQNLAEPRVAEALGVEALEPELVELRDGMFEGIHAALAAQGGAEAPAGA
jgi:hypothetical protein